MHFERYGEGDPLLILHGLFGSLSNWRSISRRLSADFQVIAADLRNHGSSPHSGEMTYPLMALDAAELLRREARAPACVLGHSVGGKVAMELALGRPDLVRKLIVVDIAPRTYPPLHRDIIDALLSVNLSGFRTRTEVIEALETSIPAAPVRQFLATNVTRDSDGSLRWRMDLESISRCYGHLAEGVAQGRVFSKPALFIRGERSDYLTPGDVDSARALFPNAEFVAIKNAGHWVHADAPQAFLNSVLRFLRNDPAPRDCNRANPNQ